MLRDVLGIRFSPSSNTCLDAFFALANLRDRFLELYALSSTTSRASNVYVCLYALYHGWPQLR